MREAGIPQLPLFSVMVLPNPASTSTLFEQGEDAAISVGLLNVKDGKGTYLETLCFLRPAILEYAIATEGGKVRLLTVSHTPEVVRLTNNTRIPENNDYAAENRRTTLDFLSLYLLLRTTANASVEFMAANSAHWAPSTFGSATFVSLPENRPLLFSYMFADMALSLS